MGFRVAAVQLKARKNNMPSVLDHPEVVTEYIKEEVQANRMHRVDDAVAEKVHCSPFGVILKKNKPNKWRLILDLSSPDGQSVNDGIDKDLVSLSYISIDNVAAVIRRAGKGALLGKMDHYINDFITVGDPESDECVTNMTRMQRISYELGLPIGEKKTEGPSTCLMFLEIELDTRDMVMHLPDSKLTQLNQALAEWQGKKAVRKRELLSLIGTLSHACKVVRSGRAFLRRLITLSTGALSD